MGLLQNNGGCRLPCWWGITPGETTWEDARNFLGTFAQYIFVEEKDEHNQVAYVQFPSPVDVPWITTLDQTYGIHDGVVETIKTYNYELATWYYLPNILTAYGQPDEVGIFTSRDETMGLQPTGIVLFYLEQGIVIEYVGQKSIDIVGDKFRICPGGTYNFIYLWAPVLELTFDEAIRKFLDIVNLPYSLRLEEATGMNVKTFFDTYKDPNTTTCLETPRDLWPVY